MRLYNKSYRSKSEPTRLCQVLRNGVSRQEGTVKTVISEWAEGAPAVLEGLIAAHFPDARVEAARSSPVPKARQCLCCLSAMVQKNPKVKKPERKKTRKK